ncbi:MAG TPA: SRPBCC domain-containing protein, partial [Acidimicrobiia bacterium]|nr:SRPBCC domain-containing protein [Acidimicrobiia bacterium]
QEDPTMITQLFKKQKQLDFERSYPAPLTAVWEAWTEAERLRQWWGPEKTSVAECEIDLRVGGRIRVVTLAGEEMGKYAGTRWPMEGTFTVVDEHARLVYEARSWTEGEEEGSTIHHTNDVSMSESDGVTTVRLHVSLTQIGPKAKLAAFGMKWGYSQQLDQLGELFATES